MYGVVDTTTHWLKRSPNVLYNHMTCQPLNNLRCKLKCKERGSKASILFLVMCAMKNWNLTGHVIVRRAFVVVLTTPQIYQIPPYRKSLVIS